MVQPIVYFIIVLAALAIAYVAARAMRVPVPDWLWQIVGIVVVAAVAIFAIRLLLTL